MKDVSLLILSLALLPLINAECHQTDTDDVINIECKTEEDLIPRLESISKESGFNSETRWFIITLNDVKGEFELSSLAQWANKIFSLNIAAEEMTKFTLNNETVKFTGLKKLEIRSNFMFDINSLNVITPSVKLTSLSLEGVDIGKSGDKLKDLGMNISRLTSLTLSNCSLERFPAELFTTAEISHLNVSKNHLTRLLMNTAQDPDEEYCKILEKLETLIISHNNLTTLDAFSCNRLKLEVLDAANNKLENCIFHPLHNFSSPCRGLFSGYSHTIERTFKNLRNLTLRHNRFSMINPNLVAKLQKLVHLDLGYNILESTGIGSSSEKKIIQSNLRVLLLDNNNMTRVSAAKQLITTFNNLKALNFSHNQWNCDHDDIDAMVKIKGLKRNIENALMSMTCHYSKNKLLINRSVFGIDLMEIRNGGDYTTYISCIIVIYLTLGFIIILCYTSFLEYIVPILIEKISPSMDNTCGRKFDAVIAYNNDRETEEVMKKMLYNPLRNRGFNIAIHRDIFNGQNVDDAYDSIVKDSRRMIVFADEGSSQLYRGLKLIRKGLQQEFDCQGFKVVVLESGRLPKEVQKCPRVLHSDRDYLEKVIKFLPQPSIRYGNEQLTFDKFDSLLLELDMLRSHAVENHFSLEDMFENPMPSTSSPSAPTISEG